MTIPSSSFLLALPLLLLALTTALIPRADAVFSRAISRAEVGLKANDADNNLTQLTFYYHDVASGSNPTTATIAQSKGASSTFGSLSMLDDPLTDKPDPASTLVGRAQGMYALADQDEMAPIMIMNLLFLEGQYNGSTLSVLGRNPVNEGVRELPVVGGTGAFRFAKGYAQVKTQTFDKSTGNSVVEYNVFVSHASGSGPGSVDGGSAVGSGSGSGSPSNHATSSSYSLGIGSLLSSSVVSLFVVPLLCLA